MPEEPPPAARNRVDGPGREASALMSGLYDELRGLAAAWMLREPPGQVLQPTALVHEAYLKLAEQTRAQWNDRAHFFSVAATAIRRILIDHARGRNRLKRGGGWERITLTTSIDEVPDDVVDLLTLDEALERLRNLNERHARVVELRFFGGLSVEECAQVLSVSERTVKDDWRAARAWLRVQLDDGRVP